MATKNRTFYAYKIVNETVSHATSGLRNDLQQKLTSAYDNFGNRCKPIADGSPVEDVLACLLYSIGSNPRWYFWRDVENSPIKGYA